MPFGSEKDAVIAVIKQRECNAANFIENNATSYGELLECLFEFAKSFDCDPAYLDDLLSLITPSELLAVGVYYDQTLASATNPKYIAKSTITTVTLNDSFSGTLEITYNSVITTINVTGSAEGKNVVVAGGAQVGTINIDAVLDSLTMKACNQYRAKVNLVKGPGSLTSTIKDGGAIYGGYECVTLLP